MMTAADCEHVWIPVLGGGVECAVCGERREPATSGICPITACRRALDDHTFRIAGVWLDHPICEVGPPKGPAPLPETD